MIHETRTSKNERAIEFWDNYHNQQQQQHEERRLDILESPDAPPSLESSYGGITDNSSNVETEGASAVPRSKEWILQDSPTLLKNIHSVLSTIATFSDSSATKIKSTSTIEERQIQAQPLSQHILEIGCGTSRLSRSLLEYVRSCDQTKQRSSELSYHIISSDVSEVCLRMNRIRDRDFPPLLNSDTKTSLKDTLDYIALDITKDNSEFEQHYNEAIGSIDAHRIHHYDIVLDKGCLDTLLFRRPTCPKHSIDYLNSPLVTNLLNNVHSILKPNDGVYFLITPRSKLKSIRDFNGFRSVTIKHVSQYEDSIEMGVLELSHSTTRKNASKTKQCAYIYTCIRNDKYEVGKHSPYRDTYGISNIPLDDDICPKCGISFVEFRSGEKVEARGQLFWTRRWRGHGLHCAGLNKD